MTGLEPWTSGVRSDRSANWDTTTALYNFYTQSENYDQDNFTNLAAILLGTPSTTARPSCLPSVTFLLSLYLLTYLPLILSWPAIKQRSAKLESNKVMKIFLLSLSLSLSLSGHKILEEPRNETRNGVFSFLTCTDNKGP